ncbi:MAG: protease SohB [Desulfobacterales bacterium]
MKDFLNSFALFLAKTLTVGLLALLVSLIAISLIRKGEMQTRDVIHVEKLNDRYEAMSLSLKKHLLDADSYEKLKKEREKDREKKAKRVFVLNFKGDMAASAVAGFREEISALLTVALPEDEVVLRLESYGGLVHSYGLAASQLQRIRDRKIPLTIAVDNIAASGGYMMACVADRLVAAPFAIIGSIGVIYAMPNFHRFLKKHDIDYEQITAGEYKRTLSMFGEITEKGRSKVSEQMEGIHTLFKDHIQAHRSKVDIERVSTGEYWYGTQALALHLVDELMTSDDLLLKRSAAADIYEIRYIQGKSLVQRIRSAIRLLAEEAMHSASDRAWELRRESLPVSVF